MEPRRLRSGFTLIELSIVLVIIGLIIGGVLMGQDLIRSAGERAQISQIEKFNSAANTFHEKYGFLPGDIPPAAATQFAIPLVYNGSAYHGDGNGIIEGAGGGAPNGYQQDGETIFFWGDLTFTHLIDGNYTADYTGSRLAVTAANAATYYPPARIGKGNSVYIYSTGGVNYFGIAPITTTAGASGRATTSSTSMTVLQAYAIDLKIDDGFPAMGNVTATWVTGYGLVENSPVPTVNAASSDSATSCYNSSTTAGVYSISQNSGANPNCALSFRFQ